MCELCDRLHEKEALGYRPVIEDPPLATTPSSPTDLGAVLDGLRKRGWLVAVHNDYRLNGVLHTFYLFTRGDHCAKGEGRSDLEAIGNAVESMSRIERELIDSAPLSYRP